MSKPDRFAWFPFYGRDFFFDETVQLFSLRQYGIYLALLWHQWEHGSIPPLEDCENFPVFATTKHDDFIMEYEPRFQAELKQVFERCFPHHPTITNRYANPRLLQVRFEQEGKSQVFQERARKGGLAKSTSQARFKQDMDCASSVLKPCYSESERELEIKKKKPPTPLPGFDMFWNAYPRKVGKADALKAWKKLSPDEALLQTILAAICKAKSAPAWLKDSGQYIPHASTWINGKRWEDDLTPAIPTRTSRNLAALPEHSEAQ